MERQYLIFIAAAGAGFAALLIFGLFINPLQAAPDNSSADTRVVEAEIGKTAYVRYSSGVIGLVQKLPEKNLLGTITSSQARRRMQRLIKRVSTWT